MLAEVTKVLLYSLVRPSVRQRSFAISNLSMFDRFSSNFAWALISGLSSLEISYINNRVIAIDSCRSRISLNFTTNGQIFDKILYGLCYI